MSLFFLINQRDIFGNELEVSLFSEQKHGYDELETLLAIEELDIMVGELEAPPQRVETLKR